MAKKKKERREHHYDLVNLCACVALFITALIYLTSWIFGFFGLGNVISILNLIGQIALLVAIAFPAYRHVRSTSNRKVWTACFWIALIIYIAVVFLGWSFKVFIWKN